MTASKLALGTAQFGSDYGINNKDGKVPLSEVFRILDKAIGSGIDTVDTAYAYGDSEEAIGKFIQSSPHRLRVISKLPACSRGEVKKIFGASLKRLGLSYIYGYLIHNFPDYKKDQGIWDELRELRKEGAVKKIGFSLYYPAEARFLLDNGADFDLIQFPFSALDQRFGPCLPMLKNKAVEIYTRSVFLQGLVFRDPAGLKGRFTAAAEKIARLKGMAASAGMPVPALCLNFVAANKLVDKVVVGVDNLAQFRELISAEKNAGQALPAGHELAQLALDDEKIIVPVNWGKGELSLCAK